jgi:hypothetical protein
VVWIAPAKAAGADAWDATERCNAMTALESRQALFLARLALALMKEVGDAARIRNVIEAARYGLGD